MILINTMIAAMANPIDAHSPKLDSMVLVMNRNIKNTGILIANGANVSIMADFVHCFMVIYLHLEDISCVVQ